MPNELVYTNGNGTVLASQSGMPVKAVSKPSNVSDFPKHLESEMPNPVELSWWDRRALDVRLKTMANTPPPPLFNYTAISVAFSFITLLILVGGLLCGAAWYMSAQNSEIQQLRNKIKETDTKAEDARKALYVNESETVEPTPTPKEIKKK